MNFVKLSGIVCAVYHNSEFILCADGDFFYCRAAFPPQLFSLVTIEGALQSVVRNQGRRAYVTYCVVEK